MKAVRTVPEVRAEVAAARTRGAAVGFVPTMGALHEGHLSLVRRARQETGFVVLSIFVNPLQFGPAEDYEAYPRGEADDLALAESEGVDVVFLPGVEDLYPAGRRTIVSVGGALAETLEGAARPGHFDGVATVVAALLNVVSPDATFFGQKDAQQAAVVRRMIADLSIPTELVVCPTVRAGDDLALSSRNAYLTAEERTRATVLYRALSAGRDMLGGGAGLDETEKAMWDVLASIERVEPEYAAAVDPDSFEAPADGGPVLLAVAARVGPARLIDNLMAEKNGR